MSTWPSLDDVPPIPADELGVWLSMTGTANNWATKARVVGLIGTRCGGDWWIAEQVAKPLGLTVPYTSRVLAELARDLVLWRDGGPGNRLYWVEVNPRVDQWRGVDWTVSRFERHGVVAQWRESATWTAPGRLFARSCSARRASAIARYMSARRGDVEGASSRALGPRDVDGGPGGGSRALRSARRGADVRALHGRAQNAAPSPVVLPRGSDSENSPAGPAGAEGGEPIDEEALLRVKAAVMHKTGCKWVNGRPLANLRRLVATVDVERLVVAINEAPAELQPLRLTEWVEVNTLVDVDELVPPVDVEAERARLSGLAANRRRMLAVYEETGADQELVDICRTELAACETRLAELDVEGVAS